MNEARPFIETCSQRLPSTNTEKPYDNRSWQPPRTKSWVLLTSISTQLSACIIEAFLVIPVVLNKNGKPNYPSSSMLQTVQTCMCVCVHVCARGCDSVYVLLGTINILTNKYKGEYYRKFSPITRYIIYHSVQITAALNVWSFCWCCACLLRYRVQVLKLIRKRSLTALLYST